MSYGPATLGALETSIYTLPGTISKFEPERININSERAARIDPLGLVGVRTIVRRCRDWRVYR